jgi:hypothetical protein
MKNLLLLACLCTFLLNACGQEGADIEIPGFDQEAWKRDKNGCLSLRTSMSDSLLKYQERLHGLREQEVLRILGRADEQELYKRNQKFLRYYLMPGSKCDNQTTEKNPPRLQLRIDAIGQVNEVHYVQ